MIIVTVTDKI